MLDKLLACHFPRLEGQANRLPYYLLLQALFPIVSFIQLTMTGSTEIAWGMTITWLLSPSSKNACCKAN